MSAQFKTLPSDGVITAVGAHLEMMGDPTRLKLLYALEDRERSVQELASMLEMSMPAVSHHLRLLRGRELIDRRKEGARVYYRLVDVCLKDVLRIAREHVEEHHRPAEEE
jgi:ArsR family transcriptional regulator, lead/cadmium/zinc/bismuth-responsive transcriptional repressor